MRRWAAIRGPGKDTRCPDLSLGPPIFQITRSTRDVVMVTVSTISKSADLAFDMIITRVRSAWIDIEWNRRESTYPKSRIVYRASIEISTISASSIFDVDVEFDVVQRRYVKNVIMRQLGFITYLYVRNAKLENYTGCFTHEMYYFYLNMRFIHNEYNWVLINMRRLTKTLLKIVCKLIL